MIKVDLITGILGAGKTTFIRKYASYLLKKGLKVGILENDYGAVNVDMLLLNDLRGDNLELEMVAGGCDMDCHTRRFKSKLISMAMSGYDRVLIEPSGLFDVDEFFDVLHDEPLDRWYEIGSVITVVDSEIDQNMEGFMAYMLASQVATAGCVVISKLDLPKATNREIVDIYDNIVYYLSMINCNRDISSCVLAKPFNAFSDADMEMLSSCSYVSSSFIKQYSMDNAPFETIYLMEVPMTRADWRQNIDSLFHDTAAFGQIYRIKGFFRENDKWHELNATEERMTLDEVQAGQQVVIIIGQNLNEDAIKSIFEFN